MDTCGERLKVAMIASGHRTPAALAREMTRRGYPVSRQTVGTWLKLELPTMNGLHLLIAAEVCGYRPRWIGLGRLPMLTIAPDAERQAKLSTVSG